MGRWKEPARYARLAGTGKNARRLALGLGLAGMFLVACGESPPPTERELTAAELERVVVIDGRVSKWLPSHFSATLRNENPGLTVTTVRFRIAEREHERPLRLEPGEEGRTGLQFLFPGDEGYADAERPEVEWALVGATGIEGGGNG